MKTLLVFACLCCKDVNMLASKMEKLGIAESDTEQQVFICMDGFDHTAGPIVKIKYTCTSHESLDFDERKSDQ